MNKKKYLGVLVCLLLTFIVLSPNLNNEFLNWDDQAYISKNPLVKDLSIQGIKNIFQNQHIVASYVPMVILSWAVDYAIAGMNPTMFHLSNIIIHLMVVFLVYWLTLLVSKRKGIALLAALLFGIHPMHVEAVSWISARKDLMYSLFFIPALISYYYYVEKETKYSRIYTYLACFVFFVLSLLSKGTAVILPFILLLFDYYFIRTDVKKIVLEKVPFFLLSAFFIYKSIQLQGQGGALDQGGATTIVDAFSVGFYGYLVYIIKSVIPYKLSLYHPYPNPYGMSNPWYFYASAIPILVLFYFIMRQIKKRRIIVFAMGFFFIGLIPAIQVLPFGTAVIAERYTYLPYFGLFLLIAYGIVECYERTKFNKKVILGIVGGYLFLLGVTTYNYTQHYKNGATVWSHVIEQYPDDFLGYMNRGNYFYSKKFYENAIEDATTGIELAPSNHWLFYNRATAYQAIRQNSKAIQDYTSAIQLQPHFKSAIINRGILLGKQRRYDLAVQDFSNYIQLDSKSHLGYYNRAFYLEKMGKWELALKDANEVIKMNQGLMAQAYYLRAKIKTELGEKSNAISDYNEVIHRDKQMVNAYLHRGQLQLKLQRYELALNDFNTVVQLQPRAAIGYSNRGRLLLELKRNKEAINDLNKSITLNPNNHLEYYNIAQAYLAVSDVPSAIRALDKCLLIKQDFTPAIRLKASL